MANVALRTSLNFVAGTLSRYRLSLGHGTLTVVLGIAVYLTGSPAKHGWILWGLVAAQVCLLGCWTALAARPWTSRLAYGGLQLVGLVFCILAAGKVQLDPFWYDPFEFLRDVPALFLSAFFAGVLLRCRGWQLYSADDKGPSDTASAARWLQIPLGEFIKWFTILCVLLGLSVSLLPPRSLLLDDWLWRTRYAYYAEFLLAVCVPAGFFASLNLLWTLARPANVLRVLSIAVIGCVATLLWIAAVVGGLNLLYNAYHFSQAVRPSVQVSQVYVSLDTIGYAFPFEPFWTLLALFLSIVFVSGTAVYSGWHIRRSA